jgi:hypothetical protein
MKNRIAKLFVWLLPILRMAALQVAADTLTRVAYPDRPRKRDGYIRYDRMSRTRRSLDEMQKYADKDVEASLNLFPRDMAERDEFERQRIQRLKNLKTGYHDVVMVAFDLSGPDAEIVHEWLHQQMPNGDSFDEDTSVHLDAWWVANDLRYDGSDCDSAVFVTKDKQAEARALLREHGLVV